MRSGYIVIKARISSDFLNLLYIFYACFEHSLTYINDIHYDFYSALKLTNDLNQSVVSMSSETCYSPLRACLIIIFVLLSVFAPFTVLRSWQIWSFSLAQLYKLLQPQTEIQPVVHYLQSIQCGFFFDTFRNSQSRNNLCTCIFKILVCFAFLFVYLALQFSFLPRYLSVQKIITRQAHKLSCY